MSGTARRRGSLTVEVVLLVPVMMVLVTLAVFGLRWTGATSDAVHAAGLAARVASESRGSTAMVNGRSAGSASISSSRWCRGGSVRIVRNVAGPDIAYSVRVTCTVDTVGLSMLGVGRVGVTATSTQIVDRYRSDR